MTYKTKKILHVITTLQTGGAERMLTRIIDATSAEARHAVIVLSPGGQFYDLLRAQNIPIFVYPLKNLFLLIWQLADLLVFAFKVKPDVICGWMGHGNAAAALIKIFTFNKAKLIWHVRMTLYDLQKETWGQRAALWLCKKLSRMPARILYNSVEGRRQHEEYGFYAENGALVDNGYNLDEWQPDDALRAKLRGEFNVNGEILIGLIARYHPMKNHAMFIDAAAQIHWQEPDVRFLLAGLNCDAQNHELMQLLKKHDLENKFILLGPRMDIPAINNALDLAVSTSSWGEGFSNSLAEAMACGTPCVSTNIGGAAHIIGDTGMVVQPDDTDTFAAAVISMIAKIKSNSANMRASARQRITDHFDIRRIAQQYLSYY